MPPASSSWISKPIDSLPISQKCRQHKNLHKLRGPYLFKRQMNQAPVIFTAQEAEFLATFLSPSGRTFQRHLTSALSNEEAERDMTNTPIAALEVKVEWTSGWLPRMPIFKSSRPSSRPKALLIQSISRSSRSKYKYNNTRIRHTRAEDSWIPMWNRIWSWTWSMKAQLSFRLHRILESEVKYTKLLCRWQLNQKHRREMKSNINGYWTRANCHTTEAWVLKEQQKRGLPSCQINSCASQRSSKHSCSTPRQRQARMMSYSLILIYYQIWIIWTS